MSSERQRIAVAMSGGVDSSVAAALLLEAGHDVVGMTLQLQPCRETPPGKSCCGLDGAVDARAVAGDMGIAHYVVECHEEFRESVLRYSWTEYSRGRTPNPCIMCNERIKFGFLLQYTRRLGISKIATGHYAKIQKDASGRPYLTRSLDRRKDQTYFLFPLGVEQLNASIFPLDSLKKAQVRELAARWGFRNAQREESQDACFVAKGEVYPEVLRQMFQASARPGRFVDPGGVTLGRHGGLHRFTVGQRRGLGMSFGRPVWVKSINPGNGDIVLTTEEQDLLSPGLVASSAVWNADIREHGPLHCEVQIRYRHAPIPAVIENPGGGTVTVVFDGSARAVTPGQAAVFYDGDRVLGGGWIDRPL